MFLRSILSENICTFNLENLAECFVRPPPQPCVWMRRVRKRGQWSAEPSSSSYGADPTQTAAPVQKHECRTDVLFVFVNNVLLYFKLFMFI